MGAYRDSGGYGPRLVGHGIYFESTSAGGHALGHRHRWEEVQPPGASSKLGVAWATWEFPKTQETW